MTNKYIANKFDLTAKLMTLHGENAFRIRTYQNAYNVIRQSTQDFTVMSLEELMEIKGLGKSTAQKIIDIRQKDCFSALEQLIGKTPSGILEIMKIKGLGAKKIRQIWKELGVESMGELEYAINENRLITLKGFGLKIQENILKQIGFLNSVSGLHLYSELEHKAQDLIAVLKEKFPDEKFSITGDLRLAMPYAEEITIIGTIDLQKLILTLDDKIEFKDDTLRFDNIKVGYVKSDRQDFGSKLFISTGPKSFVDLIDKPEGIHEEEADIFRSNGFPVIPPVFRNGIDTLEKIHSFNVDDYVKDQDVKGVIHSHTNWSDGQNSIMEMAQYCKSLGYEYLVVTDHSKSAFYANGVSDKMLTNYVEDIRRQDDLISDFKIYAGIESDILMDGNLDYDDEKLALFDVVIASVHSVLNMDKETATQRLLTAISNPYTNILGHMTGRLLLGREGYALDYNKIFESCADNNVAIELNANPRRLDIDWTLINKAQKVGVKICINPDAHSTEQIEYIKYGVLMAQKGLLRKENCINLKLSNEFEQWY